jgi:hypothetical protein
VFPRRRKNRNGTPAEQIFSFAGAMKIVIENGTPQKLI